MRVEFHPSERSTVGAEWELALVDRETGELASVARRILDEVRPDGLGEHPKIKQELLLNTIEVTTGVCRTVGEVADDLIRSLEVLRSVTDPLGVERLDGGERLPTLPPWHVQENKWRATRYGLDSIILDAAGDERLITDDLLDVLNRLEPVARRLGCTDELRGVEAILRRGASYQCQRAVARAHGGDLRAVVASLVEEIRGGIGATP